MTLIDTHCHLTDEAFADDVDQVIGNAQLRGVSRIVQACVNEDDFLHILQLANRYPGYVLPTIGIHPENMKADVRQQLSATEQLLRQHTDRVCAIGEVGLDLHWDKSRLDDQLVVLREQALWSLRYDLPLLLHVRDAMPQMLELLPELAAEAEAGAHQLRGIMHCYAGTADEAQQVMHYGDFYFGVGGTLTYKKSLVPDVVRAIGIYRLVLETDAPYLAPVPHRGKRNEPAYVADTATVLAAVLNLPVDDVVATTSENARKLFRLD
jgi:TatD DNase family protein